MSRTDVLKRISKALSPQVDFSAVDLELSKLKKSLTETVNIQTLDDVSRKLKQFQSKIDFEPLITELENVKSIVSQKTNGLENQILSKTRELIKASDDRDEQKIQSLSTELSTLKESLFLNRSLDLQGLNGQITELKTLSANAGTTLSSLSESVKNGSTKDEVKDGLGKLRTELVGMLNKYGGGSMNRQMFIGGVDPLTKYTDVNFKAGSNVTLTYANNNATKKVDITITSSGGGGGGTVRSINSISGDTSAGATSGTDYVYLCSGTLTLTLPDAAANTNLYTVKNVGSGIITIATTSSQTIDGTTTITMPVQYTAVDLISDTANWNVT